LLAGPLNGRDSINPFSARTLSPSSITSTAARALSPNSPPHSPTTFSHPPSSDSSTAKPVDQGRRSSFNFLRRQKSNEGSQRTGMLSKKSKGYQYPPQQQVPRVPPQLPTPAPLPTMDGFIGGTSANNKYAMSPGSSYTAVSPLHQSSSPPSYGVPMPPVPAAAAGSHNNNGDYVDPYARTESMTHRGRYSYASSAVSVTGINSPRRVRRRKDPTPFKLVLRS
jgi:hypothetical protein